MTKLSLIAISGLVIMLLINNAYADCSAFPGVYVCEDDTVKDITGFYGAVSVKNATITGEIRATAGALTLENSNVARITGGFGSIYFEKSTLNNELNSNVGGLNLVESKIPKGVDASIGAFRLIHSSASHFVNHNVDEHNKLILTENSQINGDVEFKGTKGHVCIDSTSRIDGKVVNADISHENC